MYMTLVMLAGFLAKDAVVDSGDNGNFTNLELLIDLSHEGKESSEKISRTESYNLTVVGDGGEYAATLKKGDFIIVGGDLHPAECENKEINCNQQVYKIRATKVRKVNPLIVMLQEPDVEEIAEEEETK